MKVTNDLHLPEPFVDAATSDYKATPKRYSVTALMKGATQTVLERRHDSEITEDVSDMVWAIFGSAVHDILRQAQESDTQLQENWISAPMGDGYSVSGIFDLYDDSTGTVTDYKTASVWKVIHQEFDDWKRQVVSYVWLMRQNGFGAHQGQIVALLKDHSKRKAETDPDYPQHPVIVLHWAFTPDEIEEAGEWITERLAAIRAAEDLPDSDLPGCTEDERWHRPDKWAVMRKGRKTALKLYDSEDEANARVEVEGKGCYVEHRPGSDPRCEEYCPVSQWCPYFQNRGNLL